MLNNALRQNIARCVWIHSKYFPVDLATLCCVQVRICCRAFKILVEEVGFDPQDVIFDPNILTVGTGLAEHNNYAVDFFECALNSAACSQSVSLALRHASLYVELGQGYLDLQSHPFGQSIIYCAAVRRVIP